MPSPNKRLPRPLSPEAKTALRQAVERLKNQRLVGDELGVSGAVISQLLRDTYAGDTPGLEERIRGKYMAETVACPVMGQLGRNHCLDYQKRPLAFTNPQRVALHRACKTCPNRRETP